MHSINIIFMYYIISKDINNLFDLIINFVIHKNYQLKYIIYYNLCNIVYFTHINIIYNSKIIFYICLKYLLYH